VEKYGKASQAKHDIIIRRIRFECWITTATDPHPVFLIITAFPRQIWLAERPSILRYTYITCLITTAVALLVEQLQ
jgi:hypothetical protein